MNKLILFIVGLGLLACATAQTPCFARITATARPGASSSWTEGSTQYQVWDITATNEGTCALTRIVGYFSAGPGRITEAWNYDSSSGLITGYSNGVLRVGETFTGAGFILANSSAPTLAFDRPGCDAACTASTSAPASTPTNAPTTAGTNAPITAGTNTPTTAGTTTPTTCPVELTQTRTTITQGSSTLYVYNITIRNTGTTPVTTPVFFIRNSESTEGTGILATTALVVYATTVPQQVLVSLLPNTVIAPGATYTAASYITNGTSTDTIELDSCVSVGAAPSSSTNAPTTNAPATTAPTGSCTVTATVVRDGATWNDAQGRTTAVYRLSITNQGSCALATYALSFGFYPGELVSSWNLTPTRGGYLVGGYGNTLAPGATYSGAGLIIAGAPDAGVAANGYGSICAC